MWFLSTVSCCMVWYGLHCPNSRRFPSPTAHARPGSDTMNLVGIVMGIVEGSFQIFFFLSWAVNKSTSLHDHGTPQPVRQASSVGRVGKGGRRGFFCLSIFWITRIFASCLLSISMCCRFLLAGGAHLSVVGGWAVFFRFTLLDTWGHPLKDIRTGGLFFLLPVFQKSIWLSGLVGWLLVGWLVGQAICIVVSFNLCLPLPSRALDNYPICLPIRWPFFSFLDRFTLLSIRNTYNLFCLLKRLPSLFAVLAVKVFETPTENHASYRGGPPSSIIPEDAI